MLKISSIPYGFFEKVSCLAIWKPHDGIHGLNTYEIVYGLGDRLSFLTHTCMSWFPSCRFFQNLEKRSFLATAQILPPIRSGDSCSGVAQQKGGNSLILKLFIFSGDQKCTKSNLL